MTAPNEQFVPGYHDPASAHADQRLSAVDESTDVGFCAAQAACAHQCLDRVGIPRATADGVLSLWGRVLAYGMLCSVSAASQVLSTQNKE